MHDRPRWLLSCGIRMPRSSSRLATSHFDRSRQIAAVTIGFETKARIPILTGSCTLSRRRADSGSCCRWSTRGRPRDWLATTRYGPTCTRRGSMTMRVRCCSGRISHVPNLGREALYLSLSLQLYVYTLDRSHPHAAGRMVSVILAIMVHILVAAIPRTSAPRTPSLPRRKRK